jgi:hypothetical protein
MPEEPKIQPVRNIYPMLKPTVLIIFAFYGHAFAAETCSRVATINYQEVLVDVSSNNRGEGLRYYIEKDELAKDLLNEYQENNKPSWKTAALSTVGTGMIIAGILRTGTGENEAFTNRYNLLIGGFSMIAISYLISRTNQYKNEFLLQKSVDEYNKRNTPKIYLTPLDTQKGLGIGVGLGQEF